MVDAPSALEPWAGVPDLAASAGLSFPAAVAAAAGVAGLAPNKLEAAAGAADAADAAGAALAGPSVAGAAAVVAVVAAGWQDVAGVPKRDEAGFEASPAGLPNKDVEVAAGAAGAAEAVVEAAGGLAANRFPAAGAAGVAEGACVAAPPNKPPAGAVAGVDVAATAGLGPNKLPAAGAAGLVSVALAIVVEVVGKRPPEVAAGAVGLLVPNNPPGAAAVVDAAGLFKPPNSDDPVVAGWADGFPNRLGPVVLELSTGGAPAGVVEGRENKGFAGVAAAAAVVAGGAKL